MKRSALICISTPLDELNWFSALLDVRDETTGDFYFYVVRIGLICKQCLQLPHEEMIRCTHNTTSLPPWKNLERHNRTAALYKLDSAARGLRENMGVVTSTENAAFRREDIVYLLDLDGKMPVYQSTENYRPDRIIVVADPDAGGAHSELAVISGFFVTQHPTLPWGSFVIIGVDAKHCTDHRDQREVVVRHIEAIRQRPEYRQSPIIFIPENQTGFFHFMMEEYVSHFPNVRVLHEHGGPKAGICKTQELTKDYVHRTSDTLHRRAICFDSRWISWNGPKYAGGRNGLITELRMQLCRYGFDEKGRLTGKYDGQFKDDLAVAFMMFVYWTLVVEYATQASPYAHLRNLRV